MLIANSDQTGQMPRLISAQADLSLRWTHMRTFGRFCHALTHFFLFHHKKTYAKGIKHQLGKTLKTLMRELIYPEGPDRIVPTSRLGFECFGTWITPVASAIHGLCANCNNIHCVRLEVSHFKMSRNRKLQVW